jgi:hypothetical protein
VPIQVGLQELREVDSGVGDRLVGPVQFGEVGVRAVASGKLGAERFQGLSGLHQVGEFDSPAADKHGHGVRHRLGGGPLNKRAAGAPRLHPNEVLHFQNAQRFTYGGPAHLCLSDQLALRGQRVTLCEFACQDPLAELAGKHVGRLGDLDRVQSELGLRTRVRGIGRFHRTPLMVYGQT